MSRRKRKNQRKGIVQLQQYQQKWIEEAAKEQIAHASVPSDLNSWQAIAQARDAIRTSTGWGSDWDLQSTPPDVAVEPRELGKEVYARLVYADQLEPALQMLGNADLHALITWLRQVPGKAIPGMLLALAEVEAIERYMLFTAPESPKGEEGEE